MRSSLLFAVASVFVASATAHDGHPHDPPATAPSGCLATPTDAVCSTFVVPNATITDAIKEICAINSFLPGCSLNAACTADSKLSTTYCAPMTILASLCIPTEDAVLTGTVCSKSYSIFCAANSLIPACKGQPAFPGLPSGKTVTGTVYSICQEMPMMTDCKICPTPEASGYSNCDEVKAWKGLCLDMPDMKQCPSYNTMCSNTKFAPFCDLKYVAPNPGNGTGTTTVPSKPTSTSDHSDHGKGFNSDAGIVANSFVKTLVLATAVGVSAFLF